MKTFFVSTKKDFILPLWLSYTGGKASTRVGSRISSFFTFPLRCNAKKEQMLCVSYSHFLFLFCSIKVGLLFLDKF